MKDQQIPDWVKLAAAELPDLAPATDAPLTDDDITNQIETDMKDLEPIPIPDAPPAPFVYRTATTDAARELISKRDMLATLVREDEGDLTYLEEQYQQQLRQLNEAHAEARSIVEARRNDRQRAAEAFAAVIDGLQETQS